MFSFPLLIKIKKERGNMEQNNNLKISPCNFCLSFSILFIYYFSNNLSRSSLLSFVSILSKKSWSSICTDKKIKIKSHPFYSLSNNKTYADAFRLPPFLICTCTRARARAHTHTHRHTHRPTHTHGYARTHTQHRLIDFSVKTALVFFFKKKNNTDG